MLAIITSGLENCILATICQTCDIQYDIIMDDLMYPTSDRPITYILDRIEQLLTTTQDRYTAYICSPLIELTYKQSSRPHSQKILPLYTSYLTHCMSQSRVGKLGFIGGHMETTTMNDIRNTLYTNYTLSDTQRATTSFHHDWPIRCALSVLPTCMLRVIGTRVPMINDILKHDMRPLKDADVDTIIPLDYTYFVYERSIGQYFRTSRQYFHDRGVLVECLQDLATNPSQQPSPSPLTGGGNKKAVYIYYTGTPHLIQSSKRRSWIVGQGKKYELVYAKI